MVQESVLVKHGTLQVVVRNRGKKPDRIGKLHIYAPKEARMARCAQIHIGHSEGVPGKTCVVKEGQRIAED